MATIKALPTSELGRFITYSDVAKTNEIPTDTLFAWHRLILAMGFEFGEKIRGVWNFSPHELYQFGIAASLAKAGHPLNAETLRQILEASADEARPDLNLYLRTKSVFAIIAVDLSGLWDVTAHMLARASDAQET